MRRRLLVAALSLVFLSVAACGGGGDDDVTTDAGTVDGAATADGAAVPDGGGTPDATPGPTDLQRLQALVAALPGAASDTARQVLVDDFVQVITYGAHGFPIREDSQLGVIWQGAPATYTLAGDFNAWNTTALPLMQPVPGFPFYYRIEPITEPLGRTLYKIVRDGGAEYLADPRARRFGYDQFGEYSLVEPADAQSHLERWPAFAQAIGSLAPRDLMVYVPAGYAGSATSVRVLYVHDGQNLFDPNAFWGGWHAQEGADAAIAGGAQPFVMVGVPNTAARMDEYTHVPDDIGGVVGGHADEYIAFLVDGVKPFIDARYRTKTAAADTGVMGSSLGGLVSIYAVWKRPDVFGFGASLSGTVGWGRIGLANATVMERFQMMAPTGATLYLDSGGSAGSGCLDSDGDGVHDDGAGGGDNYCENLDMRDTLLGLGWANDVDLFYWWEPDAQHNEAAWAARLFRPLAIFGS